MLLSPKVESPTDDIVNPNLVAFVAAAVRATI